MALSQKHRIALYDHFVPQVGEEVTEALLAAFPAGDGEELVTRDHLRAELALTREELRSEIGRLRAEVHDLHTATHHRMTTLFVATVATQLTALGLATTLLVAILA